MGQVRGDGPGAQVLATTCQSANVYILFQDALFPSYVLELPPGGTLTTAGAPQQGGAEAIVAVTNSFLQCSDCFDGNGDATAAAEAAPTAKAEKSPCYFMLCAPTGRGEDGGSAARPPRGMDDHIGGGAGIGSGAA